MRLRRLSYLLALATCAACGPRELRFAMNSDNNSGQSGFAVITERGPRRLSVYVETSVPRDRSRMQVAHIHDGTCGEVGAIRAGLSPLTLSADGGAFVSSTDPLPCPEDGGACLGLQDFETGEWLINVHDPLDRSVYVSCGEIPRP